MIISAKKTDVYHVPVTVTYTTNGVANTRILYVAKLLWNTKPAVCDYLTQKYESVVIKEINT